MRYSIKILLPIFMAFILSACSSGKLVKTYEGDTMLPQDVAVLTAPENISLISVNGKRVPKYLLSDIEVKYALQPGTNLVVFFYESVWATAPRGEEGKRAEAIESDQLEVVVDAKPGDKLTFSFGTADNIREARALAKNFKAEIVDQNQKIVAMSAPKGTYQPVQVAVQPVAPLAAPSVAAPAPSSAMLQPVATASVKAPVSSGLPPLEGMKVLWNSASTEEKKEFLKWAFQ